MVGTRLSAARSRQNLADQIGQFAPRFGLRPNSRAKLMTRPQPNGIGVINRGSSAFHSRAFVRSQVGRRQS
jgi:hypothetical protein